MKRAVGLTLACCLLLLVQIAVSISEQEFAPTGIHIALTGIEDEMSIMFFTLAESDKYSIFYSTEKDSVEFLKNHVEVSEHNKFFTYIVEGMYRPLTIHEIILRHLKPATRYFYKVVPMDHPYMSSEVYSFTTQKAKQELMEGNKKSFEFLVLGDSDIFDAARRTYGSIEKNQMTKTQFIVHVGDLSYVWGPGNENKWESWFDLVEPIAANIPYIVCNGRLC